MLHPRTTAHIIPAPGKRGARARSVSIVRSGATALALGAVLSLVGCSANPRIDDHHPIDTSHRSLNQESRVRYLILHFTWEGFEDSLKVLTRGSVSSHYLIDDSPPRIYRLVEEDRRAWHAGVSFWAGETMLNSASIGIEIVNLGDRVDPAYAPYPPAQIDAVVALVRDIAAGERIIEYKGELISWPEALRRHPHDPKQPNHTFYFHIDDHHVIDANVNGNAARWINHACDPNCESDEQGTRIFIQALRDISAGEELFYDYGLVIDERYTPKLKKEYECRCGSANCRRTMLAPKR